MRRGIRPLAARLVVGALAVLVVGGLAAGASGLVRVWEMQHELETLERDVARLRAQTQTLAQTVERLRTDPLAIEKLAREELGWVRQGETVLKFPSGSK